jgi:hypothetical protein
MRERDNPDSKTSCHCSLSTAPKRYGFALIDTGSSHREKPRFLCFAEELQPAAFMTSPLQHVPTGKSMCTIVMNRDDKRFFMLKICYQIEGFGLLIRDAVVCPPGQVGISPTCFIVPKY